MEVAGADQELWVSMLSETMKTYPVSGSLNTEITDYDHNERPIFTDMVAELKRLVNKSNDLRMLPLECQYLNKPALTALVGQQPAPIRHFTLKRKPKSTTLREELMTKSHDAQSSLKKISAPTVPLRSRGIPRKMTDTTPLKGIPSRVISGGFKTPPTSAAKATLNRTPAGRKDGGVKFLEIEDQPLGYAAAKKRKRQQELEEQQKKALETQTNAAAVAAAEDSNTSATNSTLATTPTTPTTTPDYAAGLTASIVYSQPATPMPSNTETPVSTSLFTATTSSITTTSASLTESTVSVVSRIKETKKGVSSPKRMKFEDDIEEIKPVTKGKQPMKTIILTKEVKKAEPKILKAKITRALPTLINATAPKSIVLTPTTSTVGGQSYVTIKAVSAPLSIANSNNQTISSLSHLNIPSNTIVRTVQYVTTQTQQPTTTTTVTKSPGTILSTLQKPTLITKQGASGKPTILSNIVLTPNALRTTVPSQINQQTGTTSYVINAGGQNKQILQRVVVSSGQNLNIPSLTSTVARMNQPTMIQQQINAQGTPTKIVQIKTTPTIMGITQNQNSMQNIPPLISTQQPTLLNFQNLQAQGARKTVTITQQPQQQQLQAGSNIQRITLQPAPQQQQQQKLNQIIMPSGMAMKGKTIIVSNQNQNMLTQRNVILQSIGPAGNRVYQQIPITSSMLQTLTEQQNQQKNNQMPALVPTSNLTQNMPGLTPVVITTTNAQQQQSMPRLITNISQQQPQQQIGNQVQIRPVLMGLPQGGKLTLIQRPGQQATFVPTQLVQPQQTGAIQKTIQIQQPQTIQIQQQQPTMIVQQTTQATTTVAGTKTVAQKRGLSLSVSLISNLIFIIVNYNLFIVLLF